MTDSGRDDPATGRPAADVPSRTIDPGGLGNPSGHAEPGEPPGPAIVPFAGLRRNARALVGGFLLLLVIGFVVPDLSPPPTQPPAVELLRGRIVAFLPPGREVTAPDVQIQILTGPQRGQTINGYLQGPSGQEDLPRYDIGDEVIVNASVEPDSVFISVADLYRVPVLGLLLGLFAVAVTVVGGWRGVRSLIALALTLAVIVKIVVPLILAGWEPAWVAIVAATAVTIATFLLTEGFQAQTVAAALGTFGALALTALLAVGFDALARFTTLRGSEDASYLQAIGITNIDLGGLILAAIIFGALGILDDVTVTQAAIVAELHEANPSLRGVGPGQPRDERRPVAHRGHRQHARARVCRRVAAAAGPVRRRAPGSSADRLDGDGRGRGRPGDRREHRDRRGRAADHGHRGGARGPTSAVPPHRAAAGERLGRLTVQGPDWQAPGRVAS